MKSYTLSSRHKKSVKRFNWVICLLTLLLFGFGLLYLLWYLASSKNKTIEIKK